jgi:hypothetical protein
MTEPYVVADVRRFLEELDDLCRTACPPPIRLGMHPCADKEEAALFTAEHARKSTQTDVWMVFSEAESATQEADGTVDHAVCTAITGNGPRSEVHARLYTLLHTNIPFVRWLTMQQLIRLEEAP